MMLTNTQYRSIYAQNWIEILYIPIVFTCIPSLSTKTTARDLIKCSKKRFISSLLSLLVNKTTEKRCEAKTQAFFFNFQGKTFKSKRYDNPIWVLAKWSGIIWIKQVSCLIFLRILLALDRYHSIKSLTGRNKPIVYLCTKMNFQLNWTTRS